MMYFVVFVVIYIATFRTLNYKVRRFNEATLNDRLDIRLFLIAITTATLLTVAYCYIEKFLYGL